MGVQMTTRVAQQAPHQGIAEAAVIAAAAPDHRQVGLGEACSAAPCHAVRSPDRTAWRVALRSIPVGASRAFPWLAKPAIQPIRARESINVLRLTPNVRQTAALVAPASRAAITAASFSASIAPGRPPRRPRRRAAARPALTRSCMSDRSNCAMKGYADGHEAKTGISEWIGFYNNWRPHQSLGNRTPMAVWRDGVTGRLEDKAVDMTLRLDNAHALPTYPESPQQQQAA
jgi:integrase-like protein